MSSPAFSSPPGRGAKLTHKLSYDDDSSTSPTRALASTDFQWSAVPVESAHSRDMMSPVTAHDILLRSATRGVKKAKLFVSPPSTGSPMTRPLHAESARIARHARVPGHSSLPSRAVFASPIGSSIQSEAASESTSRANINVRAMTSPTENSSTAQTTTTTSHFVSPIPFSVTKYHHHHHQQFLSAHDSSFSSTSSVLTPASISATSSTSSGSTRLSSSLCLSSPNTSMNAPATSAEFCFSDSDAASTAEFVSDSAAATFLHSRLRVPSVPATLRQSRVHPPRHATASIAAHSNVHGCSSASEEPRVRIQAGGRHSSLEGKRALLSPMTSSPTPGGFGFGGDGRSDSAVSSAATASSDSFEYELSSSLRRSTLDADSDSDGCDGSRQSEPHNRAARVGNGGLVRTTTTRPGHNAEEPLKQFHDSSELQDFNSKCTPAPHHATHPVSLVPAAAATFGFRGASNPVAALRVSIVPVAGDHPAHVATPSAFSPIWDTPTAHAAAKQYDFPLTAATASVASVTTNAVKPAAISPMTSKASELFLSGVLPSEPSPSLPIAGRVAFASAPTLKASGGAGGPAVARGSATPFVSRKYAPVFASAEPVPASPATVSRPSPPSANASFAASSLQSPPGHDARNPSAYNSSAIQISPDQAAFEETAFKKKKHPTPPVPATPTRPTVLGRKSSLMETKLLWSAKSFGKPRTCTLTTIPPQRHAADAASSIVPFYFADEFSDVTHVGSGCFFDVFRVRGRRDGKIYAVKKSKNQFRGRNDREHYLREASAIVSIHGENLHIVEIFQAWQEDGHFLMQMEYCPLTLQGLLRAHPLTFPSRSSESPAATSAASSSSSSSVAGSVATVSAAEAFVRRVAHEVAIGLMHVHAHDLVHLDIKPENILVSVDGILKIADFGSAILKNMQPDGSEGDAIYQAPELFSATSSSSSSSSSTAAAASASAREAVHTAADMFSLGLMLFEMVSQLELQKSGFMFHHVRRGGGRERLTGLVSSELEDLIMLLMDADPLRRPTAAEVMEARLWPIVGPIAPSARA